jgi:hypothetical protein
MLMLQDWYLGACINRTKWYTKKEKTVNASKECDCSQEVIELATGAGYAVGNHVWSYNNAMSSNGLSSLKHDTRGVIKLYVKAPRRTFGPYVLIKWDGEYPGKLTQSNSDNSYPAKNVSTDYQVYIKRYFCFYHYF